MFLNPWCQAFPKEVVAHTRSSQMKVVPWIHVAGTSWSEIINWSRKGKESFIQVLMSFLGWTRHRNQNPMIENIPGVWWNQLSLKDAKTIRDCKCLCVLAFSTKSMRTPFVEDTSLLPNYINVPPHQFCSLNCNPPNDFDKMLTSYLTFLGNLSTWVDKARFDR